MDLGSRAGYYTSKSPEMHLAEHLLRSKKVKARFVTKQLPSGLWTCKVCKAPCIHANVDATGRCMGTDMKGMGVDSSLVVSCMLSHGAAHWLLIQHFGHLRLLTNMRKSHR